MLLALNAPVGILLAASASVATCEAERASVGMLLALKGTTSGSCWKRAPAEVSVPAKAVIAFLSKLPPEDKVPTRITWGTRTRAPAVVRVPPKNSERVATSAPALLRVPAKVRSKDK